MEKMVRRDKKFCVTIGVTIGQHFEPQAPPAACTLDFLVGESCWLNHEQDFIILVPVRLGGRTTNDVYGNQNAKVTYLKFDDAKDTKTFMS